MAAPASAASGSASAAAAPPAALGKLGMLRLDADYKHDGSIGVEAWLAENAAAALGRSDFTMPIKVLSSHLVETVSDLRLLVLENQLRELGLPIRLCVWIEEEISKLSGSVSGIQVSVPAAGPASAAAVSAAGAALPPIPLSAPVRPRPSVSPAPPSSSPLVHSGSFSSAAPSSAGAAAAAASASPALALSPASAQSLASSPEKVGIFQYHSDFDTCGLLYYLGSRGGTAPWSNPAVAADVSQSPQVVVTASGLGKESSPLSAIVGRELVRCVTSSSEGAFIQIELKEFVCRPTNYSLKHYASYDTECLRDWKLEGSLDGVDWTLIKEHLGDTNLHTKGGTCTWSLTPDEPRNHSSTPSIPHGFNAALQPHLLTPSLALSNPARHWYRFFRVTMLGPNSNAHLYLACSGFEIYGYVLSAKQMAAWTKSGSVSGIPTWAAANYPPWPLPKDGVRNIQQGMQVGVAAGAAAAPAAADAADDDLNSTQVEDEDDYKSPLALLSSQLSNLSFVDGLKGGGALAAAAAKKVSGVSGLAALGPQGLFTYSSDFDRNGIIWALATRNSTAPWVNPMDAGLVRIHASSLMEDSAPLSAILARETVRCVTKPIPNSWLVFDFLEDKRIWLTHYTFKHYSSWDTECLRCWRLESSITGDEHDWQILREHIQDENLNGKGGTFTWSVNAGDAKPFRFLRVIQTAENSNKHHYLALSGLELYGRLLQADGVTPYNFKGPNVGAAASALPAAPAALPSAVAAVAASSTQVFKYRSDFDQSGILYWLATGGYTRPWSNPAESGLVRLTASSLNEDSEPLSAIVGQLVVRCVTQPTPDQWMALDFGPYKMIQPTQYSLRHYSSWDTEALRNWRFQATTDADVRTAQWVTLLEHKEDPSLEGKGSTHTWPIQTTRFFRAFRIFQFDKNSNKHHYLALSGFEIYGTLKMEPQAAAEIAQPPQLQQQPLRAFPQQPLPPVPQLAAGPAPFAPMQPAPMAAAAVPLAAMPSPASAAPAPLPALASFMSPSAASPSAASSAASSAQPDLWDSDAKGAFLAVGGSPFGSVVRNTGSSDKWQLCRSIRAYSSGVHRVSLKITEDPNTTNTWRFIVGVVPSSLDCKGAKQWVGTSNSWGYISGTGGKCHNTAVSLPYGAKFGVGDIITLLLDFDARTLTFFKNGESQGVAFDDLVGPVHLAASLTATDSAMQIVPTPASVQLMPAMGGAMAMAMGGAGGLLTAWDPQSKSASLQIDPISGLLRNSGSNDKWQSCRSVKAFSGAHGILRHRFDVELVECPKTNNSWQVIVGVVPPAFTCSGNKQWVGAAESWGYIGGTGGKCFNVPKSIDYGEKFGRAGDVISVLLDFGTGTIEFLRNGVSQGVAFTNLSGTVYAAVSLTATGATARLSIQQ